MNSFRHLGLSISLTHSLFHIPKRNSTSDKTTSTLLDGFTAFFLKWSASVSRWEEKRCLKGDARVHFPEAGGPFAWLETNKGCRMGRSGSSLHSVPRLHPRGGPALSPHEVLGMVPNLHRISFVYFLLNRNRHHQLTGWG